jgi:hypothetical protein
MGKAMDISCGGTIRGKLDGDVLYLARESWRRLRPDDNYDVKRTLTPEIVECHERWIAAYLKSSFNPRIACCIMGVNFDDLPDESQAYHTRLAKVVKELHDKLTL